MKAPLTEILISCLLGLFILGAAISSAKADPIESFIEQSQALMNNRGLDSVQNELNQELRALQLPAVSPIEKTSIALRVSSKILKGYLLPRSEGLDVLKKEESKALLDVLLGYQKKVFELVADSTIGVSLSSQESPLRNEDKNEIATQWNFLNQSGHFLLAEKTSGESFHTLINAFEIRLDTEKKKKAIKKSPVNLLHFFKNLLTSMSVPSLLKSIETKGSVFKALAFLDVQSAQTLARAVDNEILNKEEHDSILKQLWGSVLGRIQARESGYLEALFGQSDIVMSHPAVLRYMTNDPASFEQCHTGKWFSFATQEIENIKDERLKKKAKNQLFFFVGNLFVTNYNFRVYRIEVGKIILVELAYLYELLNVFEKEGLLPEFSAFLSRHKMESFLPKPTDFLVPDEKIEAFRIQKKLKDCSHSFKDKHHSE